MLISPDEVCLLCFGSRLTLRTSDQHKRGQISPAGNEEIFSWSFQKRYRKEINTLPTETAQKVTQDCSSAAHLYFNSHRCQIISQLAFLPSTLLSSDLCQFSSPSYTSGGRSHFSAPRGSHPILISKWDKVATILTHNAKHPDTATWRVNNVTLQTFKPRSGIFVKATPLLSQKAGGGWRRCIQKTSSLSLQTLTEVKL